MIRSMQLGRLGLARQFFEKASSFNQFGKSVTGQHSAADFEKILKQETLPAAPSRPSLMSVTELPNRGLMVNPTGDNPLTGRPVSYNPNYYATAEAAAELAAQVGGAVIDMRAQFSINQAQYHIRLPNGVTINAGNLIAVLNNAVYRENSRVMDNEIAQLLNNNAIGTPGAGVGLYTVVDGRVEYDPHGRPQTRNT